MNNKVFAGLLAGALVLVGGWCFWSQTGFEALPPLRPVAGATLTAGSGDALVIGQRNAARYTFARRRRVNGVCGRRLRPIGES